MELDMTIEEERRANCKYYQNTVDDLKKTVFGNGSPGLKMEMISLKTKVNILMTLQIATLTAVFAGMIKIFMGGVN